MQTKEDRNAHRRKWYAENADKEKARVAKWCAENPDRVKAKKAKWYAENADKEKARVDKWYAENTDKAKARMAKWHAEHRDEIKARQAKARAQALSIIGHTCAWSHLGGCDGPIEIDHVVPPGLRRKTGYTSHGTALVFWILNHPTEAKKRLQPLCNEHNRFKSDGDNLERQQAWMEKWPLFKQAA